MSKVEAMIKALNIPPHINREDYPSVNWGNMDGNIFACIGAASRAWRSVDRNVAGHISTIVNEHAEDYSSALSFLFAITKTSDDDYMDDEDMEDDEDDA
jgi:hypothetical protein